MKILVLSLALFAGPITLQEKPIVHLLPHRTVVEGYFGGKVLELADAPKVVKLPSNPPMFDSSGKSWTIEIRNQGPGAVVVDGPSLFSVSIKLHNSVVIYSNGFRYSLKPFPVSAVSPVSK